MDYKKMFFAALVLGFALFAAVAFFYTDRASQQELIASLTKERDDGVEKLTLLQEENKALNAKLALDGQQIGGTDAGSDRLKRAIDEKDAEITRLKTELEKASSRTGRGNRGDNERGKRTNMANIREQMEQRMEKFKEENPERYEQMMAERDKRQKEMQERMAKRDQYINGIDRRKLSPEQKQAVEDYQALLKTEQEMRDGLEQGETNFRDMMENQRAIEGMSTQIRDILIEQYAGTLGGTSSTQVAEEIKSIINATSGARRAGPGGPPSGGF